MASKALDHRAARASSARTSRSSCSPRAGRSGRSTTSRPARTENVAHLVERDEFHLVVESVLSPAVVIGARAPTCDVVYHLAAVVGVQLIVEQPGHTLLTNIQGTENVLEYCATLGKRVLVASSVARCTATTRGGAPARGRAADLRPTTSPPLGVRRLEGERRVPRARLARGARARLRDRAALQHVGPRARAASTGWSSRASSRPRSRAEPLEMHGDGTQTRCFSVDDCSTESCAASRGSPMDVVNQTINLATGSVYNVGSQERIAIRDLAERVAARRGGSYVADDRVRLPLRPAGVPARRDGGDVPRACRSSDRRPRSGWAPTRSLDASSTTSSPSSASGRRPSGGSRRRAAAWRTYGG